MGKIEEIKDIEKKSRTEILFAIRERVKEITDGEFDKPVFLKNVSVSDPEDNEMKDSILFSLNSIFYSGNNELCGDLMPLKRKNRGGSLVFGKVIDNLCIDDLNSVLRNLYRDNWFIMDFSENYTSTKGKIGFMDLFKNRLGRAVS